MTTTMMVLFLMRETIIKGKSDVKPTQQVTSSDISVGLKFHSASATADRTCIIEERLHFMVHCTSLLQWNIKIKGIKETVNGLYRRHWSDTSGGEIIFGIRQAAK